MKLSAKSIGLRFWGRFENRLLIYYLAAGGLWILLSDRILMFLTSSPQQLTQWQTYKGWFYVIVSGLFIWIIVNLYNRRLSQKMNELNEALKKAEESDRLKTIFLQNVSHEVRTPLNGIMGFADILMETNSLSEVHKTYLHYILKNSEELKSFMDKVLDVAIIESGSARFIPRLLNLSELVREIYFEGKHLSAFYPHLSFIFEDATEPQSNLKIVTDPVLVTKIMDNILENAFRFTESGEVSLKIYAKEDSVAIEVSDSGPGISEKELIHIFAKFHTSKDLQDTQTRGAGLGLFIANHYARLIGGKLQCTSVFGEGSVFKLEIPISHVHER